MEKITVEWANEERSILLETYLTNDWQWQDLTVALAKQVSLMTETDAPKVHIIVDVTRSSMIPKGGSLVSQTRQIRDTHPKQGTTVVVGAKGFVAKILDIATAMLGTKRSTMQTAPTVEAAHKILGQKLAEANQSEA